MRIRSGSSTGKRFVSASTRKNGVVQNTGGSLSIVAVDDVGEDRLLKHDAHLADPSLAFALANLAARPTGPTPIGVFRAIERPVSRAGDRRPDLVRA